MKKFKFVCKSELKAFLLNTVLLAIFIIFEVVIAYLQLKADNFPKTDVLFWIRVLIGEIVLIAIFLFIRYHALVAVYKITKDGVSNGIIRLKWDNIKDCKVFFPTWKQSIMGRNIFRPDIDLPPMICLGEIIPKSIFWQSKFECVTIPLTQRNLKLIDQYWQNKSPQMQQIIDENIGFPDYVDKWNVFWQ